VLFFVNLLEEVEGFIQPLVLLFVPDHFLLVLLHFLVIGNIRGVLLVLAHGILVF
jgi:hypothetical protein